MHLLCSVRYIRIFIINILFGYGHIWVHFQMRFDPVDGKIYFRPCSKRILRVSQWIWNDNKFTCYSQPTEKKDKLSDLLTTMFLPFSAALLGILKYNNSRSGGCSKEIFSRIYIICCLASILEYKILCLTWLH